MGHMLKNTVFRTAGYALTFPVGTSTVRPDAAVPGQTRYNTDTDKLEFYNNSTWNPVAKEGTVTIVKDSFTANSEISDYDPMSYSYNSGDEAQVLVFVGTVFQIPGTNYTFYGNTQIHFTGGLSQGAEITILHNYGSTISS